jgi:TatA/E family protein of Tat protein translocase
MIGTGELFLIFLVVLLLFGGKKLPELARSLGIGLREFKRASSGLLNEEEEKEEKTLDIEIVEKK